MPDERKGFLHDIIENIDDDAPRLIFADWLEDHDDPVRAEFIRLQCQIARQRLTSRPPPDLLRREKELIEAHGMAWRYEAPPWAAHAAVLHRGFTGEVHCSTPARLVRGLRKLYARAPVEELVLRNLDAALVARLAPLPELRHLRRLRLADSDHSGGLAPLFNSEHLRRLAVLDVGFGRRSASQVASLVAATGLAGVRQLTLRGLPLGTDGTSRLVEAPWFTNLRELRLYGCSLRDGGAAVLAASPRTAGLRRLELWGNDIGNPGIEDLALSPHLGDLEVLNLGLNPFGEPGLGALCGSAGFRGLRELGLISITLTAHSALALCRTPFASSLKRLRIDQKHLTAELQDAYGDRIRYSSED